MSVFEHSLIHESARSSKDCNIVITRIWGVTNPRKITGETVYFFYFGCYSRNQGWELMEDDTLDGWRWKTEGV